MRFPVSLTLLFVLTTKVLLGQQGDNLIRERVNLGFENVNTSGQPLNAKWLSLIGDYVTTIDSLQKMEGKYSFLLKRDKTNDAGRYTFAHVLFQIKGDCLKNKHIRIEGYLKLEGLDSTTSTASIYYHVQPSKTSLFF